MIRAVLVAEAAGAAGAAVDPNVDIHPVPPSVPYPPERTQMDPDGLGVHQGPFASTCELK